jgi:hypothetical protein
MLKTDVNLRESKKWLYQKAMNNKRKDEMKLKFESFGYMQKVQFCLLRVKLFT